MIYVARIILFCVFPLTIFLFIMSFITTFFEFSPLPLKVRQEEVVNGFIKSHIRVWNNGFYEGNTK